MPGIVGLVTTRPRELAAPELLRMVDAVRHDPSATAGTWMDESRGIYVGWVARKDAFDDGMPLRNERGDVLVFSGEEFPRPETGRALRERGHRVDPDGAGYLVHLYEDDPRFPAGLNGRFHGLLVGGIGPTATLFNDRYGMHRLYYHEAPDTFYFAVEAKAILAVRPELRRVDPRGLGELIACGCVLEDRTLFEGVHVLPPAAAWVFRNGSLERKDRYFRPAEWEDQPALDPEPFYEALREVFAANLPRYFEGRGRIGMSLTGGLDTRMIMAWLRPRPQSLPCYTFGGGVRDCRDVLVARKVARASGQDHEVIRVGDDFLQRFAGYAERAVYLTDGCVDVSRAPDLYVNERARDIAAVRMTGNYGGEVLRGVLAFKPEPPPPGIFSRDVVRSAAHAESTFRALRGGHPVSFAVFRQAPWHHYGLLALEQSQLSLRSPYLDNDVVRTVFRAPAASLADETVSRRLIADGSRALAAIPTDRGGDGAAGTLAAVFTRGLSTFWRKAEYAYDYGMPQPLARLDHRLHRLHLERLFLGRHKFAHFRVWYRDALADYVREVLLDPRTLARPYLDRRGIEAMVRGHLAGNENHTTAVHTVLTLELVHRLFVDGRAASSGRGVTACAAVGGD